MTVTMAKISVNALLSSLPLFVLFILSSSSDIVSIAIICQYFQLTHEDDVFPHLSKITEAVR